MNTVSLKEKRTLVQKVFRNFPNILYFWNFVAKQLKRKSVSLSRSPSPPQLKTYQKSNKSGITKIVTLIKNRGPLPRKSSLYMQPN